MPQLTPKTPLRSFHGMTGRHGKVRSAILTAVKPPPPIFTRSGLVVKQVNGMVRCDAAASDQYLDYTDNGQPFPPYAAFIKGFANKLDYLTQNVDMYPACTDTFTNSGDPTQNYVATSSLVGAGLTPQTTGYPSTSFWYIWRPTPENTNALVAPLDFNGGTEIALTMDDGTGRVLERVLSGAKIDCPGQFTFALNALNANDALFGSPFPGSGTLFAFGFKEVRATSGQNVAALNPADYDLSIVPGAFDAVGQFGDATSGWFFLPNGGGGFSLFLKKGQCKLPLGNIKQPYFIAREQIGLGKGSFVKDLPTDIFRRINLVSTGMINPGQTIGPKLESDIELPFPDGLPAGNGNAPFPIAALGTNGVISERYFAVIGYQSPSAWLAARNLHFGDNL